VEYDLAARAVRRVDVAAVLHKDEQTPHIQALVVPISDAGRLSAYTYTGGREKLGAMQDSYARAMEPLGLERGVKGSVDIHETIKEWYAKIEAPTPAPEIARQDIEIERPGRIVPNPERWAGEQEARIAERVAPALEAAATALVKGQAATAEANITVLQGQVREIARERNTLREDYKALAAQVRAVPLESVIERLGGQVDRHNHAKYRLDGEHISITGGGNDLPAHPRTATLSLAPTAPPRRSPPRPRPARRSPATRLRTPPLPPRVAPLQRVQRLGQGVPRDVHVPDAARPGALLVVHQHHHPARPHVQPLLLHTLPEGAGVGLPLLRRGDPLHADPQPRCKASH